ncbi:hypothetical protein [uncultured Campylobacter sp.]|uniref:hypothetical protein n=1 Tax=uncultured Campylobacter sp. TaxID=218934 RepID=UPI0026363310|nr:hypothetical protein [uncultured Campylobacter sp.]
MKRPVSIRDKFASKRKQKRVFRRLASCERRALYLRYAFCGEILPLPALWVKFHFRLLFGVNLPPPSLLAKFYLVSAFLSIVPTSATASFGQNFTPLAIDINRVACFVAKFYRYPQSALNCRSFIAKRQLETKPVTCYAALLVLVSEPQILNLTHTALRQNFAKILLAAETMYFRSGAISSPYSLPNRRRLNSASKRVFKISSGSHRMHGSRNIA